MTTDPVQDIGPLDWRIAIVDHTGRPTPEFQRRWNTQRNNNDLIGAIQTGSGVPTGTPEEGEAYVNIAVTPAVIYVGHDGVWERVGVFDFTQLADVPNSYAGAAGKVVRVNASATGLEFDSLAAIQGLRGPPGQDGEDGEPGPPGPAGPQGPQGPAGSGGSGGTLTVIQAAASVSNAGSPNSMGATFATTPAKGDLMFAIIVSRNVAPVVNTGWTVSSSSSFVDAVSDTIYISHFYRYAGASEPTSQTPNSANLVLASMQMWEISGVTGTFSSDHVADLDDTVGTAFPVSTMTVGTTATTNANELVLFTGAGQNSGLSVLTAFTVAGGSATVDDAPLNANAQFSEIGWHQAFATATTTPAYVVTFPGSNYIGFWALTRLKPASSTAGPQGPQGIPGFGLDGEEGPEGPIGPPGPAGAAGSPGATGPQGIQGIIGNDGDEGPEGLMIQGPVGPQGAAGATGPQGPIGFGLDGEEGPEGPIGLQGSIGAAGPQGPQGFPGIDGEDGQDGRPGSVGPTGPQGATGPQGIQGIIGNDGDEGPEGLMIQGPVGPQGATGATGPQGPIGFGMDGQDGTDDNWSLAATSTSFLPLNGGTMRGPIALESGSATAPAIGFSAALSTGLYYDGTQAAITVAGVETFKFAAAGPNSIRSGNSVNNYFTRSDASLANAAVIGQILAQGFNSTGATNQNWVNLVMQARIATTGSEEAAFAVQTLHGGALTTDYTIDAGVLYAGTFAAGQPVINASGGIVGIQASPYTYVAPLAGTSPTYTLGNNINFLIINPTGALSGATITTCPSPIDGQELTISDTDISGAALSLTANSGQTVKGPALATSIAAGSQFGKWKYVLGNTTWYRVG